MSNIINRKRLISQRQSIINFINDHFNYYDRLYLHGYISLNIHNDMYLNYLFSKSAKHIK